MRQLTQKLKDGKMQTLEVPPPHFQVGQLLVRTHFSLISAGTEGSTVKTARKGLIGKAKERPQQVKQVLETLKSQGPVQTYRAVMKKLEAYSPLGYSSCGRIIMVADDVAGFKVGDLVACGGLSASHAEVVTVPENLCVKLEKDADLRQAVYNTIGAIAMQGVRQADLRIGESCVVIGLGLLGQLTCLLLKASGVKVVGVDIDERMVELARKNCTDLALSRNDDGIVDRVLGFTDGIGCDAVIITAATDSLDPVNFAGAVSRKKGTVVVVGAVPTGFEREPHYYRKELQLKMSCSYGPGRYDPDYEEKGIDYPVGYVRWTEKRNMQAFQDLLYRKKIDLQYLTTHEFDLTNASQAYDMMMAKSEPFVGILIKYDDTGIKKNSPVFLTDNEALATGRVNVGFVGAGSYAQSHLLPHVKSDSRVVMKGVVTATGTGSRSVGERFGFEFCSTNDDDIFNSLDINTVFIASRHDSHFNYVEKALQNQKNVFVEKPLCLNEEELKRVFAILQENDQKNVLMVGYNRRFSPLTGEVKKIFADSDNLTMVYRLNSGNIPADSWIQDPGIGGGRIVGEVCHFVDYLIFVADSLPVSVHAFAAGDPLHLNDIVTINLAFENGSIGSIIYTSNGSKSLPKELVEVHGHGVSCVIEDFKKLTIYSDSRKKEKKLMVQDKGQRYEIKAFIDAVCEGGAPPIPYDHLYSASLVTFKILESLRNHCAIDLQL